MSIYEYTIQTDREGFYNITPQVSHSITRAGVRDGICVVWCPHTTAGITVTENADPDVTRDVLLGLGQISPGRREYRHAEGNSDAHIKSILTGCSQTLIVENGKPVLGTWQDVYFCEFDGPRTRKFCVKIIGG